jgi:hypothetical protein
MVSLGEAAKVASFACYAHMSCARCACLFARQSAITKFAARRRPMLANMLDKTATDPASCMQLSRPSEGNSGKGQVPNSTDTHRGQFEKL